MREFFIVTLLVGHGAVAGAVAFGATNVWDAAVAGAVFAMGFGWWDVLRDEY